MKLTRRCSVTNSNTMATYLCNLAQHASQQAHGNMPFIFPEIKSFINSNQRTYWRPGHVSQGPFPDWDTRWSITKYPTSGEVIAELDYTFLASLSRIGWEIQPIAQIQRHDSVIALFSRTPGWDLLCVGLQSEANPRSSDLARFPPPSAGFDVLASASVHKVSCYEAQWLIPHHVP